ncbi:MAG: DUF4391 domain-containing protein [Verrucomicrobiota bacterium]
MFSYPRQSEFNRVVPKSKIYAHAKPGKAVKDHFVSDIGEIVWKYKLSPETINLPSRQGIGEIQVFDLALKTGALHPAVLRAIDQAIPFPILFQLSHGDRVRFAASWKRPSEADPGKWVIEASFLTPWQPEALERPPLPVALDLASLYEQLVRQHLSLPPRPAESLRNQVGRFLAIESKEKACQQLEARLSRENQFNRKVELNSALRACRADLAILQSPESSPPPAAHGQTKAAQP